MSGHSRYSIPAQCHQFEEVIQRSRFITLLAPANSVTVAQDFLAEIRRQYPDATHHCWAFLVGPPASSGHVGMSDDGEPHGTAGRPMLNVLTHCGIGDIVAVVVRYYGGIKLGKGGLVRAYSSGVQHALAQLPVAEKIAYRRLRLLLSYNQVNVLKRFIEDYELRVVAEQYGMDPVFELDVPEDAYDDFSQALINATGGDALIEPDT